MPYKPSPNEPKYNGVYIGQLIDKPVYASEFTTAVTAGGKPYKTFKKGEFIGTLWSWTSIDGKTSMMFYEDAYYQKPFYVFLTTKTSTPAAGEIIQAEKDANKTTLEKYLDKYVPWIVGGIVVSLALPSVVNSIAPRKKIGAMNKSGSLLGLGAIAILLLAFRNRSKNKVIISPVEDITDWSNTESVYQQPRNQIIILPEKQANLIAETVSVINGVSKNSAYKKPPTMC